MDRRGGRVPDRGETRAVSLAARRKADAATFKVIISSSWTVEDGFATREGEQRAGKTRGYHCSRCGVRGHNERSCKEPR